MKHFRFRNTLAFYIISAVVALLLLFGVIVSVIGYITFSNSFKRQYTDMGYRAASTAAQLMNGDRVDTYLSGGEEDLGYAVVQARMDVLCEQMDLSLVYVIRVNTSDYGSFVSVFNSVNKNTGYTRWHAGYFRQTTNEEYRAVYRDIYENGLEKGVIFRTRNLGGAEPHITVLVPVKNSEGKVTAILCVQRPIEEMVRARRPYLITIAVTTVLLIVLVSLLTSVYLHRGVIAPIHKVTAEARRFARENSAPPGGKTLPESRVGEIRQLSDAVEKMERDTLTYMSSLTAVTAEKERIGTELGIAAKIQESSVPNEFPAFPERDEFSLFASMTPAKEVGGDFYDFFLVDDDHLALVMADVSGKGVPAALFMMVSKILISEHTLRGGSPAEVLTLVNDRICKNNSADMFVTVWLGILEISTGRLTAASAGHDDPAVCRKDGDFTIVKNRHGLVIGAMAGVKYRDFELRLSPGDKLFLYTDGLPEATAAGDRMFTVNGMLDALNGARACDSETLLSSVWDRVRAFVGDAPQFDDLTMLCLEYHGASANRPETLTVEAKQENLPRVTEFLNAFLDARDASPKAQMQLELVTEEVFVNIASYAYGDGSGDATLELCESDGVVTLRFIDAGIPWDPLSMDPPDLTLPADQRRIGGLGVFLVKKNTDSAHYANVDGKNVLTLTKRIGSF